MPRMYQYNADTGEFTVYCRTDEEEPLAVVTVSMEDSWKLMRAIDRLCGMQREFGAENIKRDVCSALGIERF